MDSICRFVPGKISADDIQTVHFVYETELHKLKQPFIRPIYYVNLVTKGSGTLRFRDKEYPIEKDTLFFMLPQEEYFIDGSEDFEYIYISFTGKSAANLMQANDRTDGIYHGFSHGALWDDAIHRITPYNANILTEGVLYYTLALIQGDSPDDNNTDSDDLLQALKGYIDIHYREQDMSLDKLSRAFSYSEKYLSAFIRKHMNLRFTEYLNTLRIQHACALISEDSKSISQISAMCGYSDPLYFSKVFKKHIGCTPTAYMKNISAGGK